MSETYNKLVSCIRNNAFNRQKHTVHLDLGEFYNAIVFYMEDIYTRRHAAMRDDLRTELICESDRRYIMDLMVPDFQRDNDKWTLARRIKFIENVIAGYESNIIMYTKNPDGVMADCKMIDGLQRSTAIDGFLQNEFPIYGGIYYRDLLKEAKPRRIFMNARMTISILKFDSERDAVQYYIDINEGLTHSDADIQRARDYMATLPEDA